MKYYMSLFRQEYFWTIYSVKTVLVVNYAKRHASLKILIPAAFGGILNKLRVRNRTVVVTVLYSGFRKTKDVYRIFFAVSEA